MSIYATLWTLKFPSEGDATIDCEWIAVRAQAVPPHIGTPTPGHGYEQGPIELVVVSVKDKASRSCVA